MKHTLSILMRNRPGALSRVTGLFSGRNFNIESLCVAETITLEITGQESKISAVLDILRPLGIKEVIRTGKIASKRTPKK